MCERERNNYPLAGETGIDYRGLTDIDDPCDLVQVERALQTARLLSRLSSEAASLGLVDISKKTGGSLDAALTADWLLQLHEADEAGRQAAIVETTGTLATASVMADSLPEAVA